MKHTDEEIINNTGIEAIVRKDNMDFSYPEVCNQGLPLFIGYCRESCWVIVYPNELKYDHNASVPIGTSLHQYTTPNFLT